MQHQIGWAWSRRVLAFVIAAALVWALLLVVERQGGAQASPRAASQAQLFAPAAATAALGAANAQQAGLALGMARSAAANASVLPPPALAPVCAALLR
ncbi:MAG: hypothetical protein M3N98_14305, partial [Actinomycetota bacterium]|nr:hypothetical protein [Actinomycetota bacterium]